jgi:hypothetical protein
VNTRAEKVSLRCSCSSVFKAAQGRSQTLFLGEIFERAEHFANGFLNPLQVKSEVVRFLEAAEKLKPRYILEIGTAQGATFSAGAERLSAMLRSSAWTSPAGRWAAATRNGRPMSTAG